MGERKALRTPGLKRGRRYSAVAGIHSTHQLRGGKPYRACAHSQAAHSLTALGQPVGDPVTQARLTEVPGIGDAIADIAVPQTLAFQS